MEANISNATPVDGPNSPALSPDGVNHTPAFTSIGQVVQFVRSLANADNDRQVKNGRIQQKYNAERPWSPSKLASDGLSWKTNFSTKPLTILVDKVVPRFVTAARNVRYLTASKLPDRFPDAAKKTEFFRREITETCRNHEGWDELLSEICLENVLFGYTAVGCLDSTSWLPRHYGQGDFLVPPGTKHNAKSAPAVCFRERYLVHELFDLIRDMEAAQLAGWDVPNVIEALNTAVPEDRRTTQSDPTRAYAELTRESSIASSLLGAKTVVVWHVLAAEVDGYVTHVAFDDASGEKLFWKDKQFAQMSDNASFYSFQHGDGKLHGSKGIGRELYNMASVLDRARNEVIDRLQLSGKLVLQCDTRDIQKFRMSVLGNAILIANPYRIDQAKIDGNVESFFQLDQFLTSLLDQIAGSTSPKAFEGERVTKAAVELYAAREEERRDSILERFLTQLARMMTMVQRRLCDPNTLDRTAKEMQQRLLKVLSPEELEYLRNQPAVSAVSDYSESERQQVVLVAQEARGNPLYNQYELERRTLTAKINAEFADAVLLPQNDPTETAENTRQQQMEMVLLQNGQSVPVSPRDNHIVHLSVLHDVTAGLIESAVDNPQVWGVMSKILEHGMAHLQAAQQAGAKQNVQEFANWLNQLGQTLQSLQQTLQPEPEPGAAAPESASLAA